MDKFLLDGDVSPEEELTALLEYNGIAFSAESGEVRFLLTEGGYEWETICRYTRRGVLIYGLFPYQTADEQKAHEFINKVNSELIRGSVFLNHNGITVRTSADLYDSYSAYESIARALEYNAGVMVKYWQAVSRLPRACL